MFASQQYINIAVSKLIPLIMCSQFLVLHCTSSHMIAVRQSQIDGCSADRSCSLHLSHDNSHMITVVVQWLMGLHTSDNFATSIVLHCKSVISVHRQSVIGCCVSLIHCKVFSCMHSYRSAKGPFIVVTTVRDNSLLSTCISQHTLH